MCLPRVPCIAKALCCPRETVGKSVLHVEDIYCDRILLFKRHEMSVGEEFFHVNCLWRFHRGRVSSLRSILAPYGAGSHASPS